MGFQKIILIIFIAYFIWHIYRIWMKPLKTFEDYRKRGFEYRTSILPNRTKKEIEILNKALELEGLTELQRVTLYGDLGQLYYKQRNYDEAVNYFDKALEVILEKDIYYSRIVNDIIESYYFAGQKERAKELYENFLQRQSHDPKFKKVEKLSVLFNK